jgi:hypothetical protein
MRKSESEGRLCRHVPGIVLHDSNGSILGSAETRQRLAGKGEGSCAWDEVTLTSWDEDDTCNEGEPTIGEEFYTKCSRRATMVEEQYDYPDYCKRWLKGWYRRIQIGRSGASITSKRDGFKFSKSVFTTHHLRLITVNPLRTKDIYSNVLTDPYAMHRVKS